MNLRQMSRPLGHKGFPVLKWKLLRIYSTFAHIRNNPRKISEVKQVRGFEPGTRSSSNDEICYQMNFRQMSRPLSQKGFPVLKWKLSRIYSTFAHIRNKPLKNIGSKANEGFEPGTGSSSNK